jgi:hypothetical protein
MSLSVYTSLFFIPSIEASPKPTVITTLGRAISQSLRNVGACTVELLVAIVAIVKRLVGFFTQKRARAREVQSLIADLQDANARVRERAV